MTVRKLVEKLKEFPPDAKIDWSAGYKELEEPIEFWVSDEKLRINFDGVEVEFDSYYDYYDECPDCGKDLI